MSFWALILGIFFQMFLAGFQMLMVIFSAASIANSNELSLLEHKIFNGSIIVLPLVSIVIAVCLLIIYFSGSALYSHWVHLVPVALFATYMVYALSFSR